ASASDPAGTLSQSTSATPTSAQKPLTTLASATINAEPDNNTAISDPGLLKEVRKRLYELNFDPGPLEGPETEDTGTSIREYEQQSRLAQTGIATMGLLRKLREVRSVRAWAAIVYSPSQKGGWGMSWATETRKEAVASARSSCRSASCVEGVGFFGTQVRAFSHSRNGWSLVAQGHVHRAQEAAL